MCNTKCNQIYGKNSEELMTSYIQSTSEIIKSVNSLAVLILETYKYYNLSLKQYTFMGMTAVGGKDEIGECIALMYFLVEIPNTSTLSVLQQLPINKFNDILTNENNLLYCLNRIFQWQSEIINHLNTYAKNGDMRELESAQEKKRTVNTNIQNVKLYMKELNELYKDVKDKKWL